MLQVNYQCGKVPELKLSINSWQLNKGHGKVSIYNKRIQTTLPIANIYTITGVPTSHTYLVEN